METNKKFLGWNIRVKNFSQKMEKTGIVCEKIRGWKIGMKKILVGRLVEKLEYLVSKKI